MWSAASVVVCALSVLGRSAGTLPPIQLVEQPPPGVSARAEAFTRDGDATIYLLTSSAVVDEARRSLTRCDDLEPVRKIASILVHEEWHIRHGADELGAYGAQLTALALLGSGPDSGLYRGVRRSMQQVLHSTNARSRLASARTPPSAPWDR